MGNKFRIFINSIAPSACRPGMLCAVAVACEDRSCSNGSVNYEDKLVDFAHRQPLVVHGTIGPVVRGDMIPVSIALTG
jgi:hypothetical protein